MKNSRDMPKITTIIMEAAITSPGCWEGTPWTLWENLLICLSTFQLSPKLSAQNKPGSATRRPCENSFMPRCVFYSWIITFSFCWICWFTQFEDFSNSNLFSVGTLWHTHSETCSCWLQKEYFTLLQTQSAFTIVSLCEGTTMI